MEDKNVPLLGDSVRTQGGEDGDREVDQPLLSELKDESKELWYIVGPAIFSLVSSYSMFVITQASAGHLGDIELAAMSLDGVIIGFDFGFLLGMASALETLCGQAFGARNYRMLGIYLQRSWVVLLGCCLAMLPVFLYTGPILKLLGQSPEVADLAGVTALYFIPLHLSYAFQFPLRRFLQSQRKNSVIACANFAAVTVHLFLNWLIVFKLKLGMGAVALALGFSWWVGVFILLAYSLSGSCPLSWTGFSFEAFSGLWEFLKLSLSSGVMLCLENWYYQILVVITGSLNNPISLDALAICMSINQLENMIPVGFFVGVGVRVATELGAGKGRKAKIATVVAVVQSVAIGLVFCFLIIFFHNKIALLFTSSAPVLAEVRNLSVLLAFTVLLNSVQPILSGVAVGSGWQVYVAYINLGCYYLIGVPLGVLMSWVFKRGVLGIWAGMIVGGTAVQTLILAVIVIRCDWDKEALKAGMHVEKWAKIGRKG